MPDVDQDVDEKCDMTDDAAKMTVEAAEKVAARMGMKAAEKFMKVAKMSTRRQRRRRWQL